MGVIYWLTGTDYFNDSKKSDFERIFENYGNVLQRYNSLVKSCMVAGIIRGIP